MEISVSRPEPLKKNLVSTYPYIPNVLKMLEIVLFFSP